MSINTDIDSDLALTLPQVDKIRTGIKGAFFVKQKREELLPSPSQSNDTKRDAEKYKMYLAGAEYDEFPKMTLNSMIGRMCIDKTEFEPDAKLSYLTMNADGDGLSLEGSIECAAAHILQVKYVVAVVDFAGLSSVSAKEVTAADVDMMMANASIKQYARESITKREFRVVNGRRQLSFIQFKECSTYLDEHMERQTSESYLSLGLDVNGNYYQQKTIKNDSDGEIVGEISYVTINSKSLKFIPAVILSDKEIDNDLPIDFGFLSPLVDLAIHMYNVSADYKYYMKQLAPTLMVSGMGAQEFEVFKKVNNRNYIEVGGSNMVDKDVKAEIISISGSTEAFSTYIQESKDKARSLGGVLPAESQTAKSATEAGINYAEQNAVLNPLINNLENGYKWLVTYCAMFHGLVSAEYDALVTYMTNVKLVLNRELSVITLDAQQVNAILSQYQGGLETRKGAIEQLIRLGYQKGEAETKLLELENEEPRITLT